MEKVKAHTILWSVIPVTLILMIFGVDNVIDVQFHDSYLVLESQETGIIFAFFTGFLAWIYWLLRDRKLIRALSLLHAIITAIAVVGMGVLMILLAEPTAMHFKNYRILNSIGFVLLFLLSVAQLVFLVNVAITLLRQKT
ncbi:hypothetical protein N9B82_01670 [Saprospiraceae bacterium]|nr:hypothetical protein [Saprospiraceae bacterium]